MPTDDLHARLVAAVTARLELARATLNGPYPTLLSMYWPRTTGKDALVRYLAAHDAADAIRRHEAALRVLQRHRPQPGDWSLAAGHEHEICCRACAEIDHDVSQPWPCDDIRDVAASYGEVIP